MEKTIRLALNKFLVTPNSLRENSTVDAPRSEITVPLAELYHQYYLDSHGRAPPNPDPAHFEHVEFLLPSPEFRIRGDGMGNSREIRRHRSNEFGHAFCRWFLYEHLNITYFAHMEHVLKGSLSKGFGGLTVSRIASGDTPDYFCAENVNKIYLAEAKGRHSSVSFGNAEFGTWRNQFKKVEVKDNSGTARSVKGFIVATRFGTEVKPSIKSQIFAEDPASPGERGINPDDVGQVGRFVVSAHYAGIATKLNQPLLATALVNGVTIPEELRVFGTLWEFHMEPFRDNRFVGGYFSKDGKPLSVAEIEGRPRFVSQDVFRLDFGAGTFFGLEEKIFRQIVGMARSGPSQAANVGQFPAQPFYSGASILRDGSMIAPIELLSPVGTITV